MKMKLNIIDNSYSYSIYLVPGLLAWTSFSTILLRLNTSIFEKTSLLKKINVPMYTFYLSIVITEFCLFLLSMSLGICFLLLVDHDVTSTFLYLIPVMIIQTIFAMSLGVILSMFSMFIKDLKEAVPILIQLWFWMTPIIYMKEMLANKYPLLLIINPFYCFVEIYQNIFLFSKSPSLYNISIILICTTILVVLAIYLYKKMISTIKDII